MFDLIFFVFSTFSVSAKAVSTCLSLEMSDDCS
jgi:hypothetical protein